MQRVTQCNIAVLLLLLLLLIMLTALPLLQEHASCIHVHNLSMAHTVVAWCAGSLLAVSAYMQLITLTSSPTAQCSHTNTAEQQVSAEEAKAKKKAAKEAAKQAEDELKLLFNDALVAGKKAPGAAAGKGSNAAEPVAVEVKEKQVLYILLLAL
jgi:hypothetical protein